MHDVRVKICVFILHDMCEAWRTRFHTTE